MHHTRAFGGRGGGVVYKGEIKRTPPPSPLVFKILVELVLVEHSLVREPGRPPTERPQRVDHGVAGRHDGHVQVRALGARHHDVPATERGAGLDCAAPDTRDEPSVC